MPVRCLNCGETFDNVKAYERHQWNTHGGDPDRGVTFLSTDRWTLPADGLRPESEYPDPPIIENPEAP